MGGIKVEDGLGNLAFPPRIAGFSGKDAFERAQQAIGHRMPFGERPGPERGVEIFEADQQLVGQMRSLEEERMHLAPFGSVDHRPDVHLDSLALETHLAGVDEQGAAAGVGKDFTQLPDHLAQHGASLRLPQLAPEQPHQSLARLRQAIR